MFRGKIERKSPVTRGVFVVMNGISANSPIAICTGKQPSFFVIDGHDIMMIFQGAMPLDAFLHARCRLLTEEDGAVATFARSLS